ncbi:MAG: ribonuclease E/G, partial [Acetobacteraceae bacterium]|nr:ribonuclease E/G [Acetobacteraceae bacterium]
PEEPATEAEPARAATAAAAAMPEEGGAAEPVAVAAAEVAAEIVTGFDVGEDAEPHAEPAAYLPPPETVGGEGDAGEEAREKRIPPRFLRNYKIQEVIKRRQILLVQVVKEERGTKGAALTTYLSLAGRYCVLMPNSPRGGGISRKITSPADRRRLKEITAELDIPRGMGLIVRTAGANRPKPEIRRDCEYLLRLWDDIREHTLRSVAPALIYEEANLIKRAIRDVYSRDLDDIVVDGEDGWRAARDFMRMLMPSHAKKVQLWRDGGQSLFARYQVDAQLDAMLSPTVQLRSGGYLVINQTEALVAIDVNSGRSTRERGIEETALRTNLEAADEVARQLRLRDLAGLIVIDFIDMESKKHNGMVERRLKEALKSDRARIQVGHISHFGLMEMSRQRLRPSLAETSLSPCPHCGGSGQVRSTESSAIHVLRQIEEEAGRRRAAEAVVHAATPVVLYILNHKRERLTEIETRYGLRVAFAPDDGLIAPQIRIDRVRAQVPSESPVAITPDVPPPAAAEPAAIPDEMPEADEIPAPAEEP